MSASTVRHSAHAWSPAPEAPTLERDVVHVWRAALAAPAPALWRLRQALAVDEVRRADRFRFERDRNRFIVARGLLRTILGRYKNIEPDRVQLRYTVHGKPILASTRGELDLRFNTSHSGDLALYAVTLGREVGVDLEHVRPDFGDSRVAERFFAPGEVAALTRISARGQRDAFFRCWTLKEAYVKARGTGLTIPLNQFDVSQLLEEPAAVLSVNHECRPGASRWSLRQLTSAPGYAAALTVEGDSFRLECWQAAEP